MKTCPECGLSLADDMFYKRTMRSGKIGLQHRCKKCSTKNRRQYYNKNRRQYYKKHSSIKYKLGLSWEEVEKITSKGACECCGNSERRLCIDHCHDSKKPRGLLCHNCNTALGLLREDQQRIINLSQYLERTKQLP